MRAGALHIADLGLQLQSLGLRPAGCQWSNVWTVPLSGSLNPELNALPAFLRPGNALKVVALPVLLLLCAWDYGTRAHIKKKKSIQVSRDQTLSWSPDDYRRG